MKPRLERAKSGWRMVLTVPLGTIGEAEAENILATINANAIGATCRNDWRRALVKAADMLMPEDQIRLADALDRFDKSRLRRDCGPRTLADYHLILGRLVRWATERGIPTLNQTGTQGYALAYMDDLNASMGPGTSNKHLNCLRYFWRVLFPGQPNYWASVPSRRHRQRHHRRLTGEELQRLLDAARLDEGEMHSIFMVGTWTGLNLGDVVTLEWGEVDLDAGAIVRARNKTGVESVVPMHRQLVEHMLWLPGREKGGMVFPVTAAQYEKDRTVVSRRVTRVFKAAKVLPTGSGDVGFTSLRVTFASRMQDEGGVSPNLLKSATGHTTDAMLRSHYTQADADRMRAAVDRLARVG